MASIKIPLSIISWILAENIHGFDGLDEGPILSLTNLRRLAVLPEEPRFAQLVPYADLSLPRAVGRFELRVRLEDAHIQLIDVEPVRGLIVERLDD